MKKSTGDTKLIKLHPLQIHMNATLMCKDPQKVEKQLNKLLKKNGVVKMKGYMNVTNNPFANPPSKRQSLIKMKADEQKFKNKVEAIFYDLVTPYASENQYQSLHNGALSKKFKVRDSTGTISDPQHSVQTHAILADKVIIKEPITQSVKF